MKKRRHLGSSAFAFMIAAVLLFVLWGRNGVERRVEAMQESAAFVALEGKGRVRIRKSGVENMGLPIVFESDVGRTSAHWTWLQQDLARDHAVLSYDRRGTGLSDEASDGADALTRVNDLDEILEKSGLAPPYLLVGHGYGASLTRLYQSLHPEKVAGIFMIDPLHPDLPARAASVGDGGRKSRRAAHFASFGLSQFARVPDESASLPKAEEEEVKLLQRYDRHLLGVAAETDGVKAGLERVRRLPPLEGVALGVLSATDPDDPVVERALALHEGIARQSRRGFHAMIDSARPETLLTDPASVSQIAADIRNLETMIPRADTILMPPP